MYIEAVTDDLYQKITLVHAEIIYIYFHLPGSHLSALHHAGHAVTCIGLKVYVCTSESTLSLSSRSILLLTVPTPKRLIAQW